MYIAGKKEPVLDTYLLCSFVCVFIVLFYLFIVNFTFVFVVVVVYDGGGDGEIVAHTSI